jgi:ABC-type glycerol-3-phosphate transport system substrate-binding protein
MRLRRAAMVPVAAIALSGAVALGGCGSDSNAATDGSTTDSMHHEAMKHDGEAMKHDGEAMKHENGAIKHHGDAMQDEGGAMKHQGKAMPHEGSSGDHMEG